MSSDLNPVDGYIHDFPGFKLVRACAKSFVILSISPLSSSLGKINHFRSSLFQAYKRTVLIETCQQAPPALPKLVLPIACNPIGDLTRREPGIKH